MKPGTREEDRQTEDDIARKNLGPRGVPGAPDRAKMTPQEAKISPSPASLTVTRPRQFLPEPDHKKRSCAPGMVCLGLRMAGLGMAAPSHSRPFELPGNHSTVDN
jgi:hypothetical protein